MRWLSPIAARVANFIDVDRMLRNHDERIRQIVNFVSDLETTTTTIEEAAVTDHGALSGLGDNDHPQYALAADAGDVFGPSSAVNNSVPKYDGTTGKLLANSTLIMASSALHPFSAGSGVRDLGLTDTRWRVIYVTDVDAVTGTFSGDIDAAGGFRRTLSNLWASAPSSSTTYTLQPRGEISSTGAYIEQQGWILAPRAGSVVELCGWMDGTAPPGVVGFWVEVSTDDGANWDDLWGSAASPVITLDPTTNPQSDFDDQDKGSSAFAAGDFLRIRIATDSAGWGARMVFSSIGLEY